MTSQEIKKIISERVAGRIVAEHSDAGHFYRFAETGKLQPSVTTKLKVINKPHLFRWGIKKAIEYLEVEDRFVLLKDEEHRNKVMVGAYEAHALIRDDAGDVGSQAHEAVERYLLDWIDSGDRPQDIKAYFDIYADPRAVASARAVEKLLDKYNIEPLASEILVGDERYSAGTLDFLCMVNGKLELWDWKTSNQIDDNYALQISAYKAFFEKMTGLKIAKARILHLSKDYDKFTNYKVLNLPQAFKAFKGAVTLYDWMYNKKEKIIKDIKRKKI